MIDLESLLRDGKVCLPTIEIFESEEFNDPAYLQLGLTNSRKVEIYAARDASNDFDKDSKEWRLEYNAKMIYYAVFFGLSLDDKHAYHSVTKEVLESIIENKLGNNIPEYTRLGEEILAASGIELQLDEPEEIEDEDEFDEAIELISN